MEGTEAANEGAWSAEQAAWVTLHALGVSGRSIETIRGRGGAEATLAALEAGNAGLEKELFRGRRGPAGTMRTELERARGWSRGVARFVAAGGAVLAPEGRPKLGRLLRAPHPPLCAYARGPLPLLEARPCGAVVGTRAPSFRGAERARALGEALARAGAVVVSGGALGVDLAAHEGALAGGGGTIAVLGEPLRPDGDERPERVRKLEDRLTNRHAGEVLTVTAHGPWVPMAKTLFVSRNRLVAGLADALIVVEAAARSGTVHTVEAALRIGIPVYAVPGDPDDELAFTPNHLILEGRARPLLDVRALLADLGLAANAASVAPVVPVEAPATSASGAPGPPTSPRSAGGAAGSLRERLLETLRHAGGPVDVDVVALSLAAPVPELLREALLLELEGQVRRDGARLALP